MELTEKQKNCPYCHSLIAESRPLDKGPDGDCWIDMPMHSTVEYKVGDVLVTGDEDFNYCPMCGRNLTDGTN